MYEEFFKLTCRPFDLAPDPKFIYMTSQHARAVANVRFALMNHDSFVIITGEIGIGKTTILNTVMEDLGPDYVTAKLVHTTLSHIELLQALLSEFGMPNYRKKKVMLLDTLRTFFLEQHRNGKHVVIIVDEAQNLSSSALEELRLLSCIDTSDRRIVSIILTGQPSLDDLLDAPGLTQLRQRARLRQRLDAMVEAETLDYIKHRLAIAGGDSDEIFEPETLSEIHRLTSGIPRLINTLCDTALTACMVDNRHRVDLEVLDNVVHELRWQWFEEEPPREQTQMVAPSPSANGRASVMVYRAGQLLEQVEARTFPFVIGRSNANELVVIDKEVSRRHALIDCIGGVYVVEDLNSKNGIRVNQKRRTRALLRSGDIISFGQVDVVFYLERKNPGKAITHSAMEDNPPGTVGDETGKHALLETDGAAGDSGYPAPV
jgi:type II secretory pathway predicted ATPase ExeA/pSer/pThr/pTyr-binding forkhead associated (FHA) protein